LFIVKESDTELIESEAEMMKSAIVDIKKEKSEVETIPEEI
tara:strand:+ start:625 stop:747 length:123 start_codon:yes stop_codon:yes gene_type:complete